MSRSDKTWASHHPRMTRVEALAITAAILAAPVLSNPDPSLEAPDAESTINNAIDLASRLLDKAAAL